MKAILLRIWNHRYCERFLRLSTLVILVAGPMNFWFAAGLSWSSHPVAFLLFVTWMPMWALAVAIPAGLLSRDNLRKSWGWLFGMDEKPSQKEPSPGGA